jgi:hypothetical protein
MSECTCDLRFENLKREGETIRFNVRLVKCPVCKAAPELLAACKLLFDAYTGYRGSLEYFAELTRPLNIDEQFEYEALKKARAAIEGAEEQS